MGDIVKSNIADEECIKQYMTDDISVVKFQLTLITVQAVVHVEAAVDNVTWLFYRSPISVIDVALLFVVIVYCFEGCKYYH